MVRTLIEREIARLNRKGYDAVVVTDEVRMDGKKKVVSLGCDSVILTGVFFDEDQLSNDDVINIASPTDCISAPMSKVTSMGVNVHKVMRQYLSISKKTDNEAPVYVNFVRICPKRNN